MTKKVLISLIFLCSCALCLVSWVFSLWTVFCRLSSVNWPLAPNVIVCKYLRPNKALYNCRVSSTDAERSLQIHPFLTNKPNFRKSQMNVSSVISKNYEQLTMNNEIKNKPNTKPIQSQFKPNTNPKQSQTNPIQTQLQNRHLSKFFLLFNFLCNILVDNIHICIENLRNENTIVFDTNTIAKYWKHKFALAVIIWKIMTKKR